MKLRKLLLLGIVAVLTIGVIGCDLLGDDGNGDDSTQDDAGSNLPDFAEGESGVTITVTNITQVEDGTEIGVWGGGQDAQGTNVGIFGPGGTSDPLFFIDPFNPEGEPIPDAFIQTVTNSSVTIRFAFNPQPNTNVFSSAPDNAVIAFKLITADGTLDEGEGNPDNFLSGEEEGFGGGLEDVFVVDLTDDSLDPWIETPLVIENEEEVNASGVTTTRTGTDRLEITIDASDVAAVGDDTSGDDTGVDFDADVESIGLMGLDINNWQEPDVDLRVDTTNDGEVWTGIVPVGNEGAGEWKFRANDTWDDGIDWGEADDPADNVADVGAANIAGPGASGDYLFTLNESTLAYSVTNVESIGVIGADINNWADPDVDLTKDGDVWSATVTIGGDGTGEWKFRLNDSWDVADWGDNDTSDNIADFKGSNIAGPGSAGEYVIEFNQATYEYSVTAAD